MSSRTLHSSEAATSSGAAGLEPEVRSVSQSPGTLAIFLPTQSPHLEQEAAGWLFLPGVLAEPRGASCRFPGRLIAIIRRGNNDNHRRRNSGVIFLIDGTCHEGVITALAGSTRN